VECRQSWSFRCVFAEARVESESGSADDVAGGIAEVNVHVVEDV